MLPQLVSFRHSSVSFDPQAKTCSGGKTIWEAGLTSYKNTLEARAKQVFNSGGQPWAAEDSANFFINCSKAFALIAQGTVTADLPAGADGNVEIPDGSHFALYEWPILQRSVSKRPCRRGVGDCG